MDDIIIPPPPGGWCREQWARRRQRARALRRAADMATATACLVLLVFGPVIVWPALDWLGQLFR